MSGSSKEQLLAVTAALQEASWIVGDSRPFKLGSLLRKINKNDGSYSNEAVLGDRVRRRE